MDFRELLKKYIAYVNNVEGADYITVSDRRYASDIRFSDEEWTELETIAQELVENSRAME
jgi:hypothetical protein